ncbi:protein catecholamines up-like [Asterias rubens]|uniref:protein catecholamines up-like n=1 Tax=Asterias rubens TaxID=7604 RepID=UPI00145558F7|nr:protein catecholamines up-like [Asterias rubens]
MVQLAVYAADPDGQKHGLKDQKKTWPLDESTMVELPLEDETTITVVEVKRTGCCSRKCAVILTVLGVLLALAVSGVALWVLLAQPACLYGPKPQEGDVVYPDESSAPEFPDYDNDDQQGHHPGGHSGGHSGGHHGGQHGGPHGGHHDGGHHGGHHSGPEGGDDHHDGWPIGGPHRPFPHHENPQ